MMSDGRAVGVVFFVQLANGVIFFQITCRLFKLFFLSVAVGRAWNCMICFVQTAPPV